ncbi:hypothetical protein [Qipengyuania sphaerica]|uniref:hypothetical protein n=1 Tax=Qipengyuania sphaerica TaxID=2867243 RepID=UPI001C87E8BF|nr:hypothetical protein [Qipengyuania sphaerica]MBX7539818.1 hypothetical protein [Qipengyuania sphaerica]
MSIGQRIKRGILANIAALGTRIAVQFATLPILFASWSVEAIGTWLILFAIPAYVALVGNGFAGAGGTAALAAVQEGEMPRARRDFRAAWAISAGSTAALALVFATTAMIIVPSVVENGDGLDIWDIAQASAWLALYVFATSQMAVFDIPYRAVGRYPDHIFLYNATSLLEIVVLAAAVTFSQSLAVLAMSLALFRCLAAFAIYLSARKVAPQMFESGHGPIGESLDGLWKPSLAFMLSPLIFGLNLQGYLLLVGAVFGAVVLAGFAATRTLARLLDLITGLVYGMQFYESGYISGDRRAIQKRMLATMTVISLVMSTGFAIVLLVLGPLVQDIYTLGETLFDPAVAIVLVLAAAVRAVSANAIALVAAENAHARIILLYLIGSALSLLVAILIGWAGAPLPVVLLPLIAAETSQLVPTMRRALAMIEMTPREFATSLVSRERLDDVKALWTVLRKPK